MRARLTVTEIKQSVWNNPGAVYVTLEPRNAKPVDNFFDPKSSRPSAKFYMYVTDPEAIGALTLGRSFFVDFTPVES